MRQLEVYVNEVKAGLLSELNLGKGYKMENFASLIGRNEQTDGTYFKYSGCYEDIAKCIRKYIPAWMVDMERFFELVVFNYIYANGDDFGLDGGLSPEIETTDVMDRTGHPCRLDFERFGEKIGLNAARVKRVLDKYMAVPKLNTCVSSMNE